MSSANIAATQAAQTCDVPSSAGALSGMLPIVLICVLFYFLIMRPQQKKEAAKREKIKQLKKGDSVVTNGGIIGRVDKVISETEVGIEISTGVVVNMYKSFIAEILEKKVEIPSSDKEPKKEKVAANRRSRKTEKVSAEPEK